MSDENLHLHPTRVAVVGAGNVMMDIARWLVREHKVDEVRVVVRRGPAEVKFDKREFEVVAANIDLAALDAEVARVSPIMQAIGQDPVQAKAEMLAGLPRALPPVSHSCIRFEFLVSPMRMLGNEAGHVAGLEVEDNKLFRTNDDTKARGTGSKRILDVDTVIFAIGDRVDEAFGLPLSSNAFAKNPAPRYPVDGISYESPFEDTFVGGWSRKASSGLVGYARKDGTNASKAVWQYLQTKQPIEPNIQAVAEKMKSLNKPVVVKEDIKKLETSIHDLAGEEFNINSPQQVQDVKMWFPYPTSDLNQKIENLHFDGNYSTFTLSREPQSGALYLYTEWHGPQKERNLKVTFDAVAQERKVAKLVERSVPIPPEVAKYVQSEFWIPSDDKKVKALSRKMHVASPTGARALCQSTMPDASASTLSLEIFSARHTSRRRRRRMKGGGGGIEARVGLCLAGSRRAKKEERRENERI